MDPELSEEELEQHKQTRIDYLIRSGEAVEFGEPWTPTTTHEWWRDGQGNRHVRLVMPYHGRGARGDDDQAEYVQRLLDMGRAFVVNGVEELTEADKDTLRSHVEGSDVTHVILNGKAVRIRYYVAPPENLAGVNNDGSSK